MFRRILSSVHKILGVGLCALFLMWFLSGFVMIFHGFPKVTSQDRMEKQQTLSCDVVRPQSLKQLCVDTVKLNSLSLTMYLDRPIFNLQSKGLSAKIYADSLTPVEEIDAKDIDQLVKTWNTTSIKKVDTLWKSDQWLMPRRLTKEAPVYKYYFEDQQNSELYISSVSGDVLQYTSREERIWAWLGVIPHWVYFTPLRQNQPVWIEFVKWTSGVSCIMCLSGMILAIRLLWRSRKNGFKCPYKKRWYRWHYISGLLFGVFAITFAFSGLMSLTSLPDWLKKKPKNMVEDTRPTRRNMRGASSLELEKFKLDYRLLITELEDVKSIEWATYQGKPYYKVSTLDDQQNISASDSLTISPFVLTEDMIREGIQQIYGDSVSYSIELITEHNDEYYNRRKRIAPLPAYKVTVHNDLNTHHYYSPETLSQQRFDDNSRVQGFLYGGLHSFNFKFLMDRPWLWNIIMFSTMIGGTFLSLTGLVLSCRWINRKRRKLLNKIIKNKV